MNSFISQLIQSYEKGRIYGVLRFLCPLKAVRDPRTKVTNLLLFTPTIEDGLFDWRYKLEDYFDD